MDIKRLAFIILGLGVVLGLGFFAIELHNKTIQEGIPEKPIELPTKPFAQFNQAITLRLNDKITFSDDLDILLKEINDSRCPKDVQCFWEGELRGTFRLSGGKLTIADKEIYLGTVNNKSVVLDGYTFILNYATTTTVNIIVEYKTPAISKSICYVGGCSGQICSDQKDVVSTCEARQEYACYKTAKCERQTNGECGWTQTSGLKSCLSQSGNVNIY